MKRSLFNAHHIKSQFKRIIRQAQGILENLAVKQLFAVEHMPINTLPETNKEMILTWAHRFPNHIRYISICNPLIILALYNIKTTPLEQQTNCQPELIAELTTDK